MLKHETAYRMTLYTRYWILLAIALTALLNTPQALSKGQHDLLLFLSGGLAYNKGLPRIAEYDKVEDLIKALSSNPYSISYTYEDVAEREPGIKILRVLWEKY